MAAQLANVQAKWDEYKVSLEKSLGDKSKPWYQGFEMIEQKTNIPRLYLFIGKSHHLKWKKLFQNEKTIYYILFTSCLIKKKTLPQYECRLNIRGNFDIFLCVQQGNLVQY